MPPTALFFLPPSPDQPPSTTLTTHLTTLYNPTPLPPWTLTHRLFRETPLPNSNPTSLDKSKPPPPQRYLQILTLSHHAPQTYVAITSTTNAPSQTRAGTPASSVTSAAEATGSTTTTGEPATIISIPTGASSEEFIQLMLSKFGPLWQQRHVLGVVNGQAFEVDDFRVRIGEVRQAGVGGGGQMGKGAVCEVEWIGGGEDGVDWEGAGAVIAGFWEGLGVKGARRVFEVAGLGEGDGSVRQWCEGLRVRG